MPVLVHIPAYLRPFAGDQVRVALGASPATVGEALEALWRLHPGIRDRVLDEQGRVRPHVNLFLGPENLRDAGGLETPLPQNAEISIVPAVSGG